MLSDAKEQIKRQTISAVITRADGTVENLGVIAYWHRNPVMRMLYKIRKALGW